MVPDGVPEESEAAAGAGDSAAVRIVRDVQVGMRVSAAAESWGEVLRDRREGRERAMRWVGIPTSRKTGETWGTRHPLFGLN